MSLPLAKEDLRIIHFFLDSDVDGPTGCVVIHKNGTAATGEEAKSTSRYNLELALHKLAKTMNVPSETADALLFCVACRTERLPDAGPDWVQKHDFSYRKKVTAGPVVLGTFHIFKNSDDPCWYGGLYKGNKRSGGAGAEEFVPAEDIEDIFFEDALEKANLHVNKLKDDWLAGQDQDKTAREQ